MHSDPLVGQVVAGRYSIDSVLGSGGMAKVYIATQLSMQRPVALKVLRRELLAEKVSVERFRREVLAVARLQSPHTIEFYDFDQSESGDMFIAMELLKGETLRDRLNRESVLAPDLIAAIVRQVAASLGEAHRAGVLHRDLKPENVHFCGQPTPLRPFVKVLDFGLAKLLDMVGDGSITGERKTVGTPAYMAPEMAIAGGHVDQRSDLYALAIMAYEMLVGERPFHANNPFALMKEQAIAPVPSLYGRGQELPHGVDAFMQVALAKDPDERMPDASTFAQALAGALGERRLT